MNWEDEPYIKTYTRDTAEWVALAWQAKALACLMLRKVDRAGVIQLRDGPNRVRLLSGLVGLPVDVTAPGLADLLADGCVVESVSGFCFPNFIEAQEARTSDKQRQAKSRSARRDRASVTKRDTESQNVTESHSTSQHVTGGHTASHGVTNRLDQLRPDQPRRREEEDFARVAPTVPSPDTTAPKDPPPPPTVVVPVVLPATPSQKPDVAPETKIPPQPAQPVAPKPKPNAAHKPIPAPPHPEVTYSEVRELWQAVRRRPNVRLREWPAMLPMEKQRKFDPVIQQRPIEGPGGWRAVMDALAKSTFFNGNNPGVPELLLDQHGVGTVEKALADHYYDEPEQPKKDPHVDDQSRWNERERVELIRRAEEKARKAAEVAAKSPPNP